MIITNASFVTWGEQPQILSNITLLIQEDRIQQIDEASVLLEQYPQEDVVDAGGQLVMPGNICAHTHFYGAYARGMAIPGDPPADFPAILRRLWWNLDLALDMDAVRASALVCLVDAIKHGTTSLIDHHASPNALAGSLDTIAKAIDQSGLRAVLCYEVTDRNGMDEMQAGIEENIRFIESSTAHPRIRGTFGLHASMSLNDETLQACADAASDDMGFHIHVAEHESDEEDSLRRSGKRVVPRLDEYGIWRENTIAAHCVHIDGDEQKILRERGVWITHQPRSNMNNAVGAMRFDAMVADGMKICLGNDGFSNNMWAEWKAAYLLHKVVSRDARQANGSDVAYVATVNNARLLEQFFPDQSIGEIAVGSQADLIFVDYQPFTDLNADNLPWHILFGFESSMVTSTMVAGRFLMQDRKLLTLDETAIAEEARSLAPKVWDAYTQIANNSLH